MDSSLFLHLNHVLAAPESSHRWHRLCDALQVNGGHPDSQAVLAQLEAWAAPSADGQFLRASFLHSQTPQMEYLRAAAHAAKEIVPFRVERIHALLLYAWSHALTFSPDRSHFSAIMDAVDVAELLRVVSRELEPYVESNPRRAPFRELRRVAIVTSDLRSIANPGTVMALKAAGQLSSAGIAVKLFATQEQGFAAMPLFLGGATHLVTENLDTDSWKPHIRNSVTAQIGDQNLPLIKRWRFTMSWLDEFDPDVVLFIGFISPLPLVIYPRRPLATLSVHTVPPIVPSDVWLAPNNGNTGSQHAPSTGSFISPLIHPHPFRVFVKPTAGSTNRGELKLPEDAVVLVSIGARLNSEINAPWASSMIDFLLRHPRLNWLLVGGNGTMPTALAGGPAAGRIRAIPHHSDVRSICRCCDVYVNPPRMGGGFSVADAMVEGLAVVAYRDSDGGDKLGDFACASDASYFETLEALVLQPALRRARGAALQERFQTHLDIDQGRPSLVAGCEKAIARFNERIAHPR